MGLVQHIGTLYKCVPIYLWKDIIQIFRYWENWSGFNIMNVLNCENTIAFCLYVNFVKFNTIIFIQFKLLCKLRLHNIQCTNVYINRSISLTGSAYLFLVFFYRYRKLYNSYFALSVVYITCCGYYVEFLYKFNAH